MIAILDSGMGGLSVMREIIRLMPQEKITYMADSANCPYGNRSPIEITRLSLKCVDFLAKQGADIIVLACNTITAASAKSIRQKYPNIPIIGMEPAIKPATQSTKSKVIGVLATKATLAGQQYQYTKSQFATNNTIIETAGEGLVEIVENQTQNKPESIELLQKYIQPMMENGADTIVLGCTHYPFLINQINQITQGKINVINPAPAVAKHTKKVLEQLYQEKKITQAENTQQQYTYISTKSEEETIKLKLFAQELFKKQ